jgi:squalene-associated FAD-dependent desaturase
MSERGHVVIVGGGLAGITAALDCAAGGARVTLLEVRRRLGGAAYSFERDGLEMDNGQHVFLRCCVAYRGLLNRIGSERLVTLQPRLRIPVLSPGAPPVLLERSGLPAPAHMALALARYPHLSARHKLGAVRAVLALLAIERTSRGRRELRADRMTLGDWLGARGQDAQAVAALWDLIALPTLNVRAEEASLSLGAFVFRHGVLSDAAASDIGFHGAGLSETIAAPSERALKRAGVEIRLGCRVARIDRAGAGFEVHAGGDGVDAVDADAVIVALPHERAAGLLEPLLGARAARLRGLGSSPIVNLHVVYDRPVLDEPFAAGVGTPVQYLFDRTAAGGAPAGCQYLAVSLSGADREMSMSVAELREHYVAALAELLPRARSARIESFLVTREHAATFRATPGTAALRPGPVTAVPGLVLAGTWTATAWPATLESAVLSGHAAATATLARLDAGAFVEALAA